MSTEQQETHQEETFCESQTILKATEKGKMNICIRKKAYKKTK